MRPVPRLAFSERSRKLGAFASGAARAIDIAADQFRRSRIQSPEEIDERADNIDERVARLEEEHGSEISDASDADSIVEDFAYQMADYVSAINSNIGSRKDEPPDRRGRRRYRVTRLRRTGKLPDVLIANSRALVSHEHDRLREVSAQMTQALAKVNEDALRAMSDDAATIERWKIELQRLRREAERLGWAASEETQSGGTVRQTQGRSDR